MRAREVAERDFVHRFFGPEVLAPNSAHDRGKPSMNETDNLFTMLRQLDRPDFTAIAVMPIPECGLGLAINDRLRRAAFRSTTLRRARRRSAGSRSRSSNRRAPRRSRSHGGPFSIREWISRSRSRMRQQWSRRPSHSCAGCSEYYRAQHPFLPVLRTWPHTCRVQLFQSRHKRMSSSHDPNRTPESPRPPRPARPNRVLRQL